MMEWRSRVLASGSKALSITEQKEIGESLLKELVLVDGIPWVKTLCHFSRQTKVPCCLV